MTEQRRCGALVHELPGRTRAGACSEQELEQRGDLQKLDRFVRRLAAAGFFGKVTISMQHGKVTDVRLEQALKIDEM